MNPSSAIAFTSWRPGCALSPPAVWLIASFGCEQPWRQAAAATANTISQRRAFLLWVITRPYPTFLPPPFALYSFRTLSVRASALFLDDRLHLALADCAVEGGVVLLVLIGVGFRK